MSVKRLSVNIKRGDNVTNNAAAAGSDRVRQHIKRRYDNERID